MIFRNTYLFPAFSFNNMVILCPVSIGHERIGEETPEAYDWNNTKHGGGLDYSFIQYTLSGTGRILVDGKEQKLETGTGFICRTTHTYRYWFDKNRDNHWEFLWIGFKGKVSSLMAENIQREFGKIFSLSLQSLSVNRFWDLLARTKDHEWKNDLEVSLKGYDFLLQLIDDLRNRASDSARERIDQALAYIKAHFFEPLDVSILSPRFGYSREHFTRLFRQRMGVTPGQFILGLRINRAKELLRSTEFPLEKVAAESGLLSANYLCRIFREKVGLSPRQYPESHEASLVI